MPQSKQVHIAVAVSTSQNSSPAMMLAAMFATAAVFVLRGLTPSNSSLPSPLRLAVLTLWV